MNFNRKPFYSLRDKNNLQTPEETATGIVDIKINLLNIDIYNISYIFDIIDITDIFDINIVRMYVRTYLSKQ